MHIQTTKETETETKTKTETDRERQTETETETETETDRIKMSRGNIGNMFPTIYGKTKGNGTFCAAISPTP